MKNARKYLFIPCIAGLFMALGMLLYNVAANNEQYIIKTTDDMTLVYQVNTLNTETSEETVIDTLQKSRFKTSDTETVDEINEHFGTDISSNDDFSTVFQKLNENRGVSCEESNLTLLEELPEGYDDFWPEKIDENTLYLMDISTDEAASLLVTNYDEILDSVAILAKHKNGEGSFVPNFIYTIVKYEKDDTVYETSMYLEYTFNHDETILDRVAEKIENIVTVTYAGSCRSATCGCPDRLGSGHSCATQSCWYEFDSQGIVTNYCTGHTYTWTGETVYVGQADYCRYNVGTCTSATCAGSHSIAARYDHGWATSTTTKYTQNLNTTTCYTTTTRTYCIYCGYETYASSTANHVTTTTTYSYNAKNANYCKYTQKKCSKCGTTTITNNTAHTWTTVIDSYATCTQPGYAHKHCSVCGYNQAKYVWQTAKGHNWQWVVDSELSCTTNYTGHKHCTNSCHSTARGDGAVNLSTVVFAYAPGHHYEELVNEKEATCTTDGSSHYQCTNVINGVRCTSQSSSFTVPATGHYITSDAITETPSVYENGTRTYYCEYCGEAVMEDEIVKRHFNVYLGDARIEKIYLGDELVWNGSVGDVGTDGGKTTCDDIFSLVEDNWYYIKNHY